MVNKVTVTIKGVAQMEQMLKNLGPRVAARIGDRALRAAAKPIIKDAKRRVPKRTGELRRSICGVVQKRADQNGQRVVLIGFRPPTSRRAHLVEFGTSHSAAKPFMRPALDSQHAEALKVLQETLADGIAREEFKRAIRTVDFSIFDDNSP